MAFITLCKWVQRVGAITSLRSRFLEKRVWLFHRPAVLDYHRSALYFGAKVSTEESPIDRRLRRIDQEVRRVGRISRREIEDIFEEIRIAKHATGTQSLLLIRCCGTLLSEELPNVRTVLVEEIWNTLNRHGVSLDISHYNALLRVYLENEHPFSPSVFLSDLESKGIEPNRVTYQRFVEMYCQLGDIEGATHILEFMRAKQLPVNENIFNSLIVGHSEAGDLKSAADIVNVMKHAGLEPSSNIYTTLLCAYAKHGDMASLRYTLKECQQNDITLLNQDFMDIIYSLAIHDHHQHIDEIFDKLLPVSGYGQDLFNLILKLANKKQYSIAKKLFLTKIQNKDSFLPCGDFIKHMVKIECPIHETLALCEELKRLGVGDKAILEAAEASLANGQTENSYSILLALKNDGFPIRPHYFWPLLASVGKANNLAGVFNILETMRTKFEVTSWGETLQDYVVPWLLKIAKIPPTDIVSKLESSGTSREDIVSSVVYNLLLQNNLSAALKFYVQYNVAYNLFKFRRQLIQAYHNSRDAVSLSKILTSLQDTSESSRRFLNESRSTIDKSKLFSDLVFDAVASVAKDNSSVLKLLQALKSEGMNISNSTAERIVEKIGEEGMTAEISELLEKLTTRDMNQQIKTSDAANGESCEVRIHNLRRILRNPYLTSARTRALKKQLLSLYCRQDDVEQATGLWKELREDGATFSPGLLAQLIALFLTSERLNEALELYSVSKEKLQDFTLDRVKVIKFVSLLIKDNIDDAVKLLQQNSQEKFEENSYVYNNLCRQLLNQLVEEGEADNLKKLFNALVEHNYINVNNSMLGPLVKVHIVRNDMDSALKQFEECYNEYRCTPLKKYLTCKLIDAEDAVGLQRLTDISTKVHGEVNSLHDLVFAFVECGRVRQARKILETPGLLSRPDRLRNACEQYLKEGDAAALEGLVEATKSLSHINPLDIYQHLLLTYCKRNDAERALDLWVKMQEENITPTNELLVAFASFLKEKDLYVPFSVPQVTISEKL